ncbi:MAG: disulfide bond formation protein B [bacterium]|nr:disulfide bond formation protein B [bacterium]
MPSVEQVNNLLSVLVVISQITVGFLLLSLLFRKKKNVKKILSYFSKKAFLISFLIALTSMLGSLFYSEVAGYGPCKLCWYQRILMYPLVLLFGFALLRKRKDITDYALLMSLVGGVIAGYHYLLQIGLAPNIGCAAIGYSISCSQRFVMQFGYITLPLMSFTGFLIISTMLLVKKLTEKKA